MSTLSGNRIRERRREKGYTLDRLAKLSGSSKSYIWGLENGTSRKPSAEKVLQIAEALEVTFDYLIDPKETPMTEEIVDTAFFRKYRKMNEDTKYKIRRISDILNKER